MNKIGGASSRTTSSPSSSAPPKTDKKPSSDESKASAKPASTPSSHAGKIESKHDTTSTAPISKFKSDFMPFAVATYTPESSKPKLDASAMLDAFKGAANAEQQGDARVVTTSEYFFGETPMTPRSRGRVTEDLKAFSGQENQQGKLLLTNMLRADPDTGKTHNTTDLFQNGKHEVYDKKAVDYDQDKFPGLSFAPGERPFAKAEVDGKAVLITTCADNKAFHDAQKQGEFGDVDPDIVIGPAANMGAANPIGKPGTATVVADGQGSSTLSHVVQGQSGLTSANALGIIKDSGFLEHDVNPMAIRRDKDTQKTLAKALDQMMQAETITRDELTEALGQPGSRYQGVLEALDKREF